MSNSDHTIAKSQHKHKQDTIVDKPRGKEICINPPLSEYYENLWKQPAIDNSNNHDNKIVTEYEGISNH